MERKKLYSIIKMDLRSKALVILDIKVMAKLGDITH